MEWLVGLIVVGFLLLVSASKSVLRPVRWVGILGLQVVIGAILLFFVNLLGDLADFHLPINPITALLVGFLRIPGLVALLVIKLFIMA